MFETVVAVLSLLLPGGCNRRQAMQAAAGVGTALLTVGERAHAASAPSTMGGLLQPFIDTSRGYKIYKPSGAWNEFDVDPGVFDKKWQDIIEPDTTVQVSSSPVEAATSVSALGDLQAVGAKFAKSRQAKLVKATERDAEGALVYVLELEGDQFHELIGLCISRGKLFRISAVTSNKKWPKRAELYSNILASFVPKGF
jgi:photosystem II oxygen-evolving enhancer protein 2